MSRSRTRGGQEGASDRNARTGEPPPDAVFENLSNSRRREVVKCLHDREGSVEISSLVDEVAAAENSTDVQSITYEQRKRVYTTLHQSHLPKLVEDGFVERNGDQVRLTGDADRLKAHIELEADDDLATDDATLWDRLRSRLPF